MTNTKAVYDDIKELILNMSLKPGEFVSEAILAKKLNVSRTPIREALKRLEQEGLIIADGRRKRVFILTLRDLEEIFDLKKIIEPEITKLAIARGKEEDFQRLAKTIEELEALAKERPKDEIGKEQWFRSWFKKDKEFHDIIFEMAKNRRAKQIVENLNSQWHRLRIGIDAIEGRIEKSLEEHKAIALGILNRNPEEAEIAMIEHLKNLYNSVAVLMKLFHFPE
ncbi:MAG: GntR family transcriptional regulator [bacterium]